MSNFRKPDAILLEELYQWFEDELGEDCLNRLKVAIYEGNLPITYSDRSIEGIKMERGGQAMKLVEIAKGVSVNPEKVIMVTGGVNQRALVYVQGREPFDSDYTYAETIKRLEGADEKE